MENLSSANRVKLIEALKEIAANRKDGTALIVDPHYKETIEADVAEVKRLEAPDEPCTEF